MKRTAEGALAVRRQINVTLDDDTAAMIESIPLTERGRFIDSAIRQRASTLHGEDLRRLLKEGAIARADRDREIAEEWASVDPAAQGRQESALGGPSQDLNA
jgi:CopG family transcriptional regulator / antitoxin EndoAI